MHSPAIDEMAKEIRDGTPITDLQVACAKMGLFDVLMVIVGLHALMYMIVPVTKAAADTVVTAAAAVSIGSTQLAYIDDLIKKEL